MSVASYPNVRADEIAWITEADMVEVDRVMIEDLHIELIQMMENAGRHLATLVIDRCGPRTAMVLCGSGGNGGGGLVAARHLANRGVDVIVTLGSAPDRFGPIPAHQLDIVERMGVSVNDEPTSADVVVDALVGYSLRGAPRGRVAELITTMPSLADHIVALDVPSGLDASGASNPGVVVHADTTLTLAMPKLGLRDAPDVGELYLADISVPHAVFQTFGIDASGLFDRGPIVRVTTPDEPAG